MLLIYSVEIYKKATEMVQRTQHKACKNNTPSNHCFQLQAYILALYFSFKKVHVQQLQCFCLEKLMSKAAGYLFQNAKIILQLWTANCLVDSIRKEEKYDVHSLPGGQNPTTSPTPPITDWETSLFALWHITAEDSRGQSRNETCPSADLTALNY